MTDQEINTAIAKYSGMDANYLNDLNAMYRAEELMSVLVKSNYSELLFETSEINVLEPRFLFNLTHISARQRAIAYCKAIGYENVDK